MNETRKMEGIGEVPANLSQEYIESCIRSQRCSKVGEKTTMCITTLVNGFEIITSSACVEPGDYDPRIGEDLAKKKAVDKVWELEGYRKQSMGEKTHGPL